MWWVTTALCQNSERGESSKTAGVQFAYLIDAIEVSTSADGDPAAKDLFPEQLVAA